MEHADDGKEDESEGEAEGTTDAHSNGGDGNHLPFSERFFSTSKPLCKRVQAVLPEERTDSRIFYGNNDLYTLFRLHQVKEKLFWLYQSFS